MQVIPDAALEIIAAESLGVRGLCCKVDLGHRRIVIDPGVALGYLRHGLLPHPLQVAIGEQLRENILATLEQATDVVFSHFHGDHIPFAEANPYQLSMQDLPSRFRQLRGWCLSPEGSSPKMEIRFQDLKNLLESNLQVANGRRDGPLSFSRAVPHGKPGGRFGSVMMTRIDTGKTVFVHASDIQLLDDQTVDSIIRWRPDIVLAAGPPLYLEQLTKQQRRQAWNNALRLADHVDTLILDHHLLRSVDGLAWLAELSSATGKQVYCAADFEGVERKLFEARRQELYQAMPVPNGWHGAYARGDVSTGDFLKAAGHTLIDNEMVVKLQS
jgi:predicted metallo-beta-lactamase superfamily hydrolase